MDSVTRIFLLGMSVGIGIGLATATLSVFIMLVAKMPPAQY